NAMNHGIEKPEERVSKGKSPKGSIALRCEPRNDQLRIEVKDDGRGVAIGRIYQKAIENWAICNLGLETEILLVKPA
ncbi:MAG TPA: hypothetical protein PKZ32_17765, partial [Candidatus Melainabacteria bacterium]|nr:hypothetical protein [Candidatus Melainabacteria bacterium]